MGNYGFAKSSKIYLKSAHSDLQKILWLAKKRSDIDFDISCTFREIKIQKQYYAQGRTTPGRIITDIDGVEKLGKHNIIPAEAADLYCYTEKGETSYTPEQTCYIGGIVTSAAKELLEKGEISHGIIWGANWDGDGTLLKDQDFDDIPHFELVKKGG